MLQYLPLLTTFLYIPINHMLTHLVPSYPMLQYLPLLTTYFNIPINHMLTHLVPSYPMSQHLQLLTTYFNIPINHMLIISFHPIPCHSIFSLLITFLYIPINHMLTTLVPSYSMAYHLISNPYSNQLHANYSSLILSVDMASDIRAYYNTCTSIK